MDEPICKGRSVGSGEEYRKRKRSEDHLLRDLRSSRSPPPRRSHSDNWAQRAEAFIYKVKDPSVIGNGGNTPDDNRSSFPSGGKAGIGAGSMGYNEPTGQASSYPNRKGGMNSSRSSIYNSYKSSAASSKEDSSGGGGGSNKSHTSEGRRSARRKRDESTSSSSSSSSDSENDDKGGDQRRSKLTIQKDQYERAEEKLEAQLIKLKEQREALKEGGAKHEDKIMKDNARLQKEVKNRLSHMKEVLDKISDGLDSFKESSLPKSNNNGAHGGRSSPSTVLWTRRSKSRNRSLSQERTIHHSNHGTHELNSKAKRHFRSDSEEYNERDSAQESRRGRKKKYNKYRGSSSSSEESDLDERKKSKTRPQDDNLPLDDSILRLMSDLRRGQKSSKQGDETTFMDLLGKMSEAYMKAKKENKELSHRINALESENSVLKKQLESTKTKEPHQKWDGKSSHIIEVSKPKRKKRDVLPVDKPRRRSSSDGGEVEDTSRSVRAKMYEEEEERVKKNGAEDKMRRRRRDRSLSRERRSQSRDRRQDSPIKYREERRAREDRRSPSYPRKEEKIDLDEWVEKPCPEKEEGLKDLKEKMKVKEQKTAWAEVKALPQTEEEHPPQTKKEEEDQPIMPSEPPRPQVAIQWGQRVKRSLTPESSVPQKKPQPLVGKMPNKAAKKPGESRFGPPANNIPPPGVLSSVPRPIGLGANEQPPAPPPVIKRNPPKNPTPVAMDMSVILAAAKAHMRARSEEFVPPEIEIPLPPLPAASDKDPSAHLDTRPPKAPTPPPTPREKTEMELMLEKHCPEYSNMSAPLPHPPPSNHMTSNHFSSTEEEMDPSELEMLGIDPSDLAGFGN